MKQTSKNGLAKRVRSQLIMLGIMFLLGMAVNLIGFPSETSGGVRTTDMVFIALHVLIAIGLIAGALITMNLLKKHEPGYTKLGWSGFIAIIITFTAGVLTMAYENNWWSYVMAIGFIASLWIYGLLYFRVSEKK